MATLLGLKTLSRFKVTIGGVTFFEIAFWHRHN